MAARQPRKQIKSPMVKYTLQDMKERFPDDDTCLDWLRHKLYPEKIYCQKCGKPTKHHRITTRRVYGCDFCGSHISPTAGTIFHKSDTPLVLWFYAIYLMSQTRTGISAKQLERELGVTYKTAWRMFKLIRSRLDEGRSAFSGDVEVDETYVGGRRHGKRGRGAEGKTPVVGAVQRKGNIKAAVVPDVTSQTVLPFVETHVEKGSTVHTDEFNVYDKLGQKGYTHERVQHSQKVYVVGNSHTNTIEGFWAQVKNAVNGVHHGVGVEYLQDYVNEYAFRYSHRNDVQPMFWTIMDRVGVWLE